MLLKLFVAGDKLTSFLCVLVGQAWILNMYLAT